MGINRFIVAFSIFMLVSNTCTALFDFQPRKLAANESHNAPANSSVSPTGSPTNMLNNTENSGKPEGAKPKDSHKDDHDNKTLPTDPKKASHNLTDGNPSTEKSGADKVDQGNKNVLKDDDSCEESLARCRIEDHKILACVKASKNGSGKLFVVVRNEGKSKAKVNVYLPNDLKNILLPFDVDRQKADKKEMPSSVGKSTKLLLVEYGKAKCTLKLAPNPIFVDNLIQQLSFYSKQVTPIYIVYGSILLVLLFGGTFACCKLRKRNRENGIPYQELEMGFPESAANVDAAEGWDHDWDDDDWDEETAVKSPAGHQIRNVSADGLTSRSPPKKDGWDNEWAD